MRAKEKKAWQTVASAPRKSYLGRVGNITPSQKRWVKAILTLWGNEMGGSCEPKGCSSVIGRLMIRTEWADKKGQSIVDTVNALYKLGYRGDELFKKAREIIIPQSSFNDTLRKARENDDAEFVERVALKTFDSSSPILIVSKHYYCGNYSMREFARYLADVSRIILTEEQSRDRVRWCLELFEAKMYKALQYEMEQERLNLAA